MPALQILDGTSREKWCLVRSPRALIGRGDSCDVVLADVRVSREHALLLELPSGRWVLQDLGSENGVFVNGARARELALDEGDRIRLGKTELVFRMRGYEAAMRVAGGGLGARSPESPTELDTAGEELPRADLVTRVRSLERMVLAQESEIAGLARELADARRELAFSGYGQVLCPPESLVLPRISSGEDRWGADFEILPAEPDESVPGLVRFGLRASEESLRETLGALSLCAGEAEGDELERVRALYGFAVGLWPRERLQRLVRAGGVVGVGGAAADPLAAPSDLLAEALGRGWTGGPLRQGSARFALLVHASESGMGQEGACTSMRQSLVQAALVLLPEAEVAVLMARSRGPRQRLVALLGGLSVGARSGSERAARRAGGLP